jgi:hypothetical protein
MHDPVKYCGRCKQVLPVSLFAKSKAKKDGLQERCTPCRSEHHQKTKHKRPKQTKEQKRKYLISSYGLTVEEYQKLLNKQNNACAICKTTDWGRPSPSIDHCHTTGKVRGLLCNNCNRAIGLLKDNKEILKNAIKYLK